MSHALRAPRGLCQEAAHEALDRLLAEGVRSIAVCLVNAYANGQHEQADGARADLDRSETGRRWRTRGTRTAAPRP